MRDDTDVAARAAARVFLEQYGLGLDDLERSVPDVQPDELVLLGGSVPEGLANAESDIDLMIVSNRRFDVTEMILEGPAGEAVTKRERSGAKVSIEFVKAAHLDDLAGRMRQFVEALHNPERARKASILAHDDIRTIHRVRTGIRVRNPGVTERLASHLNCEHLADYMALLFIGFHFSFREDALGELKAGRTSSALWNLRESLGFAAGALLASIGETNPTNKWRVRLLERHAERIGASMTHELLNALLWDHPTASEVGSYLEQKLFDCDAIALRVIENRPAIMPTLAKMQSEAEFRTHL